MIIRFVKMEFKEGEIDTFKKVFNSSKDKIRNFKGVLSLELLQDENNPCIFFTKSIWDKTDSLEQYRKSDLFTTTWAKTKTLFNAKPQAWTLNLLESL